MYESAGPDTPFVEFAVNVYLNYSRQTHTRDTFLTRRRLVVYQFIPYFRDRPLGDITRADIERFLASRQNVSNGTRNRALSALRAVFRRAVDLGLIESNPGAGIRMAREHEAPLPLVSAEQVEDLIQALPEICQPLFITALDTGARLGELLRLLWQDIDLTRGTVLIRQSKNKRPRVLQMTKRLQATLAAWSADAAPDVSMGRIFQSAVGGDGKLHWTWRRAFKTAARAVDLPDFRIHDLRHVAAIILVRAGMDLPSIQAYLGHRSLASTLRYAAYMDESAAARAARLLDAMREAKEDSP